MNINQILEDIRNGKPIMLSEGKREDEVDLVIAAEKITYESLLFMIMSCHGLICCSCTSDKCKQLNLDLMTANSTDKLSTPFTISVDANEGTTTGMSVNDKLKTISVMVSDSSKPEDLGRPGHLFPLKARDGLLLERKGHTESSIELMKLAGMKPVAIIVEIMNPDGTMMRGEKMHEFASKHGFNIISVEEIYDHVYGDK